MSAKKRTPKRPFIHALYDAPQNSFTADEWQVVRRMVHTTGDFSIFTS
ncbi:MAG: precorrin-8X methylmutase [Syntrophales bacterium]